MTDGVQLKGMTWSDPRGYDPLVAATEEFSTRNAGVSISWDKRSLQGFESTPVEELAAKYDLMIIDHPHVGSVARSGCLLALDEWIPEATLAALANETVGKSYVSYALGGHQWALPVDAATQVQAYRPDLVRPAQSWSETVKRAAEGSVILPMRPPHSLMCIYTLTANIGHPCGSTHDQLFPDSVGNRAFEALKAVTDHIDVACFEMDPIAALDVLSEDKSASLAPLVYLYKGYANEGYRNYRVGFADIAPLGQMGPIGSALGGTGLAISKLTHHPEICANFAAWVAGAECQSGIYQHANGQPGNAIAWSSEDVNAPVLNAYWATRMTHEAAWLRPRHDGYMTFQQTGSEIVNEALTGRRSLSSAVAALNSEYAASFQQSCTAA